MKHKLLLIVLLFFAVGAVANPHTITYYQTYGAWLTATSPAHFAPPEPFGCLGFWCHYEFQPTPIIESLNPYRAVNTDVGSFGAPRGVFTGTYQVWLDRVTVGKMSLRLAPFRAFRFSPLAVTGTSRPRVMVTV